MALLFADGFDCYANTTHLMEAGWGRATTAISLNTSEGRFGGGCIKSTASVEARCSVHVATGGTIIIGWSYKHDGNGGATDTLLTGQALFGAQLFRLEHNASGDLKAFNNPNSQVGSTATGAIPANTWVWIEIKVVLGTTGSNGSLTVKVDGTSVITAASIDTFSAASEDLTQVKFKGSEGIYWMDDVVICDGSGSTMNDFLGPTQIDTLAVVAAGGTTNWTANTGTQAAAVDDATNATDDDTTYIESKTAAQEARFAMDNLTVEPNTINAVQVRTRSKKENAGNRTYRGLINVSGTEALGTTVGAPTDYAWMRNGIFYNNPNTSAAWASAAEINALQAGVEIVA